MRLKVIWVGLALILTCTVSSGEQVINRDLGLGLIFGAPTGVSVKYWVSHTGAMDAAAGWNFRDSLISIHAGYLYHFPVEVQSGFLGGYLGVGGAADYIPSDTLQAADKIVISARGVLGVEYIYSRFGVFAEVNPMLSIYPGFSALFGAGLGARFYF